MTRFSLPLMVLWLGISAVHAQAPFSIPLRVTDGVDTVTLSFGVAPYVHFCVVESDSIDGLAEYFLPPAPPSGVFDARFIWPRLGSNLPCFDQGTLHDFRPTYSPGLRDTFRVKCQLGNGTTMMLKWPRDVSRHFFVLWLRYFDQNIGTNLVVNMLSDTTADVTGAGDPATVNIYSSRVVSVEQPPPPAPEEYALLQNYPNPFNPETNVGYWIGEGGFVSLKVYDVLGRKVRTLANEVKRPGTYTVRFDGSWLAGGVYFYRLEAGNYVSVKKMLLVR